MSNNRLIAVDHLRVISMFSVIIIHTTTRLLEFSGYNLEKEPLIFLFNQLSRFAVPLFFMISGLVLEANYQPGLKSYFQKRIIRTIPPYIFWSTIYYFLVFKNQPSSFPKSLILGDASYQLYFVPTILILYTLFPIIHKNIKILSNIHILILMGLVQIAILNIDYNNPLQIIGPIRITILNLFVFLLGMAFFHHKQQLLTVISRHKRLLLWATIVLGLIVTEEGYRRFTNSQNYLSFYSQWRPSILLYTISTTSLLYYLFTKVKTNFIEFLSGLSFNTFLNHVAVMEIVWHFSVSNNLASTKPLFTLLFIVSTTIFSLALAKFLHITPLSSKISG